uniref:Fimbrin n=1 Tax=Timema shepardi TaxID=629360 RepID=A0A7R9FX36_TIMSH|nr:unnamed protein product [Timema shepardi]
MFRFNSHTKTSQGNYTTAVKFVNDSTELSRARDQGEPPLPALTTDPDFRRSRFLTSGFPTLYLVIQFLDADIKVLGLIPDASRFSVKLWVWNGLANALVVLSSTAEDGEIEVRISIDKNGDGFIDLSELKEALDICGFKLPGWKVRKMIEDYDNKRQITDRGRLSFEEFETLCGELKGNEVASTFKQVVSKKENLETLGGMSDASSEGTTHSVRLEEQLAFSDWINTNLGSDPDLRHLLPIDPEGKSLYDKIGLFNQITLENCPGLTALLMDEEHIEDLMRLSPEAILLRWVNYHLQRAGVARRCNNFQGDITDSEIYTHLLKQIAPSDAGITLEALRESNLLERAELMLQQAAKLGCRSFVTPSDVVNGIYKLNLAFVANLFNNHPSLDLPEGEIEGLETLEETREEKNLADGLVIFQLYDIIKPGIVNWNKVHRKFSKLRKFMEKLENCNYAVELGKQLKFSLVGIAGQDLNDGNATLTLAVELNTTSALANYTTEAADARVVIDLLDAIKPGTIHYEFVKEGGSEEENLINAKYAISMARKTGARVYALPEDITEVKPKMVMTVFACLMAMDYIPNMDAKHS